MLGFSVKNYTTDHAASYQKIKFHVSVSHLGSQIQRVVSEQVCDDVVVASLDGVVKRRLAFRVLAVDLRLMVQQLQQGRLQAPGGAEVQGGEPVPCLVSPLTACKIFFDLINIFYMHKAN